jgi:hypothetical protein
MRSFKYREIFNTVLENKKLFELRSEEFFETKVKPEWIGNGKQKLRLSYTEEGEMVMIANRSRILAGEIIYFNLAAYEVIEGSDLRKASFLWFLSSQLKPMTRYFRVMDIWGWVFKSGITWNEDSLDMEYGAKATISVNMDKWITLAKDGLCRDQNLNAVFLADKLKIVDIYELVGSGYKDYVASRSKKKVNIPKSINNKMDFLIWKGAVNKIKITGKNFPQISYFHRNTYINNAGDFKFEIWEKLLEDSDLAQKKYFFDAFMETEFDEGDIKGKVVSQQMLKRRFNRYLLQVSMWRRDQQELINLMSNTDFKEHDGVDLVNFKKWVRGIGLEDTYGWEGMEGMKLQVFEALEREIDERILG